MSAPGDTQVFGVTYADFKALVERVERLEAQVQQEHGRRLDEHDRALAALATRLNIIDGRLDGIDAKLDQHGIDVRATHDLMVDVFKQNQVIIQLLQRDVDPGLGGK